MTKEFGDWRLRCIESEAVSDVTSSKQCEIIRIAQIQETDIAVTILTLSLTMISNENAKQQLAMTNIGPLNIYLPDQLEYKIDGKSALKAPFNTCNEAGCWSQQILDQKTIDALRKGKIAQAKFRMITGQPVTVEFTLKGISAALDEVSKNSK
ncbi:invasion associated locus B family protein [Bartonella sp. W8122]|nr:invasion associated locus B family protein [Bartonella sp. W8122]MBI0001746.1 invasion associated locus B family protein [Bartonella sp. W8122]